MIGLAGFAYILVRLLLFRIALAFPILRAREEDPLVPKHGRLLLGLITFVALTDLSKHLPNLAAPHVRLLLCMLPLLGGVGRDGYSIYVWLYRIS